MTEDKGIRTPNIPPGTDLGEFIGHEIIGSTRSIRRFSRASVIGSIEAVANSFTVGGGVIFTTLPQALANLNYNANQMAWVIQDATPANNGVYQKTGASGSGSWARRGNLPYAFYRALNDGSGTPNAIQATNGYPLANKDAIIVVDITDTTTASPVTISFNGETPLTIKTASGNDPAPGGLVAGMVMAGYINADGTQFRLLSDQASASIVPAAENAQAAAEAAKVDAQNAADAAIGATGIALFATKSAAEATTLPASTKHLSLAGYSTPGVGPWRVAVRVSSEPSHEGKLRTTDRYLPDGSTDSDDGGWWELADEILSPLQFGAPIGSDATTAIQATFDTAVALKRPVQVAAMFRCDSSVTITAPGQTIKIAGGGPDTGFDFTQGSGRLTITGSATQIPNMSTDMAKGDVAVNFASAHGLGDLDVIAIWNPTPASWLAARDAYNAGEFFRVYDVASTTTVYLYGSSFDAYVKTAVQVWKINQVNALLSDFTVKESPNTAIGLRVTYGCGRATGVRGDSVVSTGIELDRCYGFYVDAPRAYNNSPFVNDEYGISIANCQAVTIMGGDLGATRHAVSIGGYEGTLNVVNRSIRIIGCDLMNYNGSAESADMHGNADYITYENCICRNAAGVGGANITYLNCQIWSHYDNSSGYAVYGTELRGGLYRFIDCVFNLQKNGDFINFGAIHLIPNFNNDMKEKFVLEVTNCHFRGAPGNASGLLIQIDARTGSNLQNVNVRVTGGTIDIGVLSGIVFAKRDSGGALPSEYLVIDGALYTGSGSPSGIYPHSSVSTVKKSSRLLSLAA